MPPAPRQGRGRGADRVAPPDPAVRGRRCQIRRMTARITTMTRAATAIVRVSMSNSESIANKTRRPYLLRRHLRQPRRVGSCAAYPRAFR